MAAWKSQCLSSLFRAGHKVNAVHFSTSALRTGTIVAVPPPHAHPAQWPHGAYITLALAVPAAWRMLMVYE
jgi:hypothetical protein